MAVFKKDMACTRAEMAAGLGRAFGAEPRAEGADMLSIPVAPGGGTEGGTEGAPGVLRVTMGPQQTRTIAMLSIKHMDVTLAFEDMNEAAVREALGRFDRAFQRGGG